MGVGARDENRDISQLLEQWTQGHPEALQSLIPIVYDELRKLARHRKRQEFSPASVQTTTIVHEAYMRLVRYSPRSLRDRRQFFAMASTIMRQVLVDRAREKQAQKRDAGVKVELTPELAPVAARDIDILALDEALHELEQLDARQGRIVELRFFAGLSIGETAQVLSISAKTVTREWLTARAWLQRRIGTQVHSTSAGASDV